MSIYKAAGYKTIEEILDEEIFNKVRYRMETDYGMDMFDCDEETTFLDLGEYDE